MQESLEFTASEPMYHQHYQQSGEGERAERSMIQSAATTQIIDSRKNSSSEIKRKLPVKISNKNGSRSAILLEQANIININNTEMSPMPKEQVIMQEQYENQPKTFRYIKPSNGKIDSSSKDGNSVPAADTSMSMKPILSFNDVQIRDNIRENSNTSSQEESQLDLQ